MIVACLKWVTHPGEPNDARFAGMSPADQSALEFALAQATATGAEVTVVTVGPLAAEAVLRDAVACGAHHAIRIDAPATLTSAQVAEAISTTVPSAQWVWCGDYSLDRGTGSVPAFLAANLAAQQALGVIAVEPSGNGQFAATRRLDGGRREVLAVSAPAVISVEGATAHLRRAGLGAVLAAARTQILVRQSSPSAHADDAVIYPYRPRARALAAPRGAHPLDRLRALTDSSGAAPAHGESVVLAPAEAAVRIVAALREWGYLE